MQATAVDESELIDHIGALFETTLVSFEELPQMTKVDIECGANFPIHEIFEHLECSPATTSDDFNNQLCDHLEKELIDPNSQDLIEKCFMINDGHYTENEFSSGWRGFLDSIANGHRFFNREAKQFLDNLFHILTDDFDLAGKGIIRTLDFETPLYRARVVSSTRSIKEIQDNPASQLGPTPSRLATDQRMSPAGISVFYGALDRDTCISEIRPLVGDSAISAEFRIMSELNLVDLNKLPDCIVVDDIYDDEYIRHSHAVSFFKELVYQMSRPARRGEGNPYLPTQFIFEYLRVQFGDLSDGILYSSVQQDQTGSCVALFPESSQVSPEPMSKLKGEDPFSLIDLPTYTLFHTPGSLRYHRVRGVSYIQEEDDSDFKLTASDNIQAYLGTRF